MQPMQSSDAQFVILVPCGRSAIVRGAGLVANAKAWYEFERAAARSPAIHAESGVFGDGSFVDKVARAAYRLAHSYSTTGTSPARTPEDYQVVGTLGIDPWRITIVDLAALVAWGVDVTELHGVRHRQRREAALPELALGYG